MDSKLNKLIKRDATSVASWPESERDRCRAELTSIFHNPGIQFNIIKMPEYSDWTCRVSPGVIYRPEKGREPNWFHRKMQYLVFGFKWERRNVP